MKGISIILIQFTLLLSTTVYGQTTAYKKADKLFNNFQYSKAIKKYEKLLEDNPEDMYLVKRLARANYKIGDYENATRYYGELAGSASAEPADWYQYAQLLKVATKYTESKKWFEKYLTTDPQNELVKEQIQLLSTVDALSGSRKFIVRRTNKNSIYTDMSPAFYKNKLVFCSARDTFSIFGNDYNGDGQPFLDLYIAGCNRMVLYEVQKFSKELNSPFHEGPVAFNADGSKIFFTRNNLVNGKRKTTTEGVNNLKIYISEWDGKKWGKESEFPFNSNEYSVAHPAVSQDGKTIYFVSNMPGGYGKTDIYRTQLTDQGWSQPENLGPTVNTAEKEMFPTLDNNDNLYFSSDGHPGLGGLDLFIAIKEQNGTFLVQNLGNTINSSYDDFSLVFDKTGESGYFSSNRPLGAGEDDIYYFEVEEEVTKSDQPLW